jgi:hypothetical protein
MTLINLSEEDFQILQKCLNDGVEPPQELAKKLFPTSYSTFDFKTLKDSKTPTIEYQGKRSEAAILNKAAAFGGDHHSRSSDALTAAESISKVKLAS